MLKYVYACMNAGKTAEVIKEYNLLKKKGLRPVIAKPDIDTREGVQKGWGFTKSRLINDKVPAYYFKDIDEVLNNLDFGILLIDEVQFMTEKDIVKLIDAPTDVVLYGLKTDANATLFPASAKLLAIADEVREIPMLCEEDGCMNRAQVHSRYIDGKLDTVGEGICPESSQVTYKSHCVKCWRDARKNCR